MSQRNASAVDRRTVLKTAGVVAVGALAGCSGSSADDSSASGDGGSASGESGSAGSSGGDGGGTATPADTSTATTTESSGEGASVSFDGWFDGVANFDAVADETGQSEVEVTVGAQGNGGNFAFAPPAIRVSPGTTVVWRWTGAGGSHNVVAESGRFESELVSEEGHTFSYTFEDTGTTKYACTPHETVGMKGAVVVE